jgi:hypothetical protein
LLNIAQALIYKDYPKLGNNRQEGLVEQRIHSFINKIVTNTSADLKTNPLL